MFQNGGVKSDCGKMDFDGIMCKGIRKVCGEVHEGVFADREWAELVMSAEICIPSKRPIIVIFCSGC